MDNSESWRRIRLFTCKRTSLRFSFFRAVLDLFFPIPPDPEPDFQIDCNFTNLMRKTLRTYEWFEFLIIFCAAVMLHHLHALRSNLCRSNVTSTYYVSKKYLNNLTFNNKIDFSSPAKLCSSGGIFARAGFLADLEKVPDSGQSWSRNPVQPYHFCYFNCVCHLYCQFKLLSDQPRLNCHLS